MKNKKILRYDIVFNWKTMKWEGLTKEHFDIWATVYPDVDAFRFLTVDCPRFMMRYVVSRDGDTVKILARWRNRNWPMTINNWLRQEQLKAVGL